MSQSPHVDLIARAAGLMRQRALAASASPWTARDDERGGSIRHSGPSASTLDKVEAQNLGRYVVCGVGAYDLGLPSAEDTAHIVSWHPTVALAVADWLDIGANPYACVDLAPMLAVAQAYLREPALPDTRNPVEHG